MTLVPDVGVVEKSYDADANPVIEPLYALRCISVFTLALRVFISAAVRKLGIIFTLLFLKTLSDFSSRGFFTFHFSLSFVKWSFPNKYIIYTPILNYPHVAANGTQAEPL